MIEPVVIRDKDTFIADSLNDISPAKLKNDDIFWKLEKDKDGNVKGIRSIDYLKFIDLLYRLGFRRMDIDRTCIFVQIINHRIVREVSHIQIADAFFNYIEELEEEDIPYITHETLINKFLSSLGTYFNEKLLWRLTPREPLQFNTDTREVKYMYFKNCYIEITKDKVTEKKYETLRKFIWESEVINRDFSLKYDKDEAVIRQFINKVCNEDSKRVLALKTITGYAVHNFSECKLKAVILTDMTISEDGEANGRTGKSLYCKAIGHIISGNQDNANLKSYCEINGKDFNPAERYKYQRASLDTKVLVLNDVKRNFDMDVLYNDITEGVTVERKNQNPFVIKPKIIITTNKTIKIEGDSSKDRVVEFEFSSFFSKENSPEKVFGHWFFRDWNPDEWRRFDTFMIECVQEYLKHGLIEPDQINLNMRKLYDHTCREFVEYMESLNIMDGEEFDKKQMYSDFIEGYPDYNNGKLRQHRFSLWIKSFTILHPEFEAYNKETDEVKNDKSRKIKFRRKQNG